MMHACDILRFFLEFFSILVETYATTIACCLLMIFVIIIFKRVSVGDFEIEIEEHKNAVEGENIEIHGKVEFHPLLKSVKWQKLRRDAEFIDINIQSAKYRGSSNDIKNPRLCISSVDVNDESDYRIEAQILKRSTLFDESEHRLKPKITKHSVHSNTLSLKITNFKVPNIEISCNGKTEELCCIFGESITFNATIQNPDSILCLTWQKETKFGAETLNTEEPKYYGSTNDHNRPELHIHDISFSDEASYYLLATSHEETESNKVYLKVQGDLPDVSLRQHPKGSVDFGETVKYTSSIRCNSIPTRIIWRKGNTPVEFGGAKYNGSSEMVDNPVLIINNVDEDDEDFYTLEVHNAVGMGKASSERLIVNDTLPKVQLSVSSDSPPIQYGNNVILQAVIKSSQKPKSIQWRRFHEKERIGEPINIKSEKYRNSECLLDRDTCTLVINNLDYNDQGKYEINVQNAVGSVVNEIEIDVQVDDKLATEGQTNCYHFLCLMSVCTDEMRKVFDKLKPLKFEEKWQNFQKNYRGRRPLKGNNLPTSSKDLDVTLMYTIIRNGTTISPPSAGWETPPDVNATAIADDIERIRMIRNEFSHKPTIDHIDTTSFNKWTVDLIKIICRLSLGDKEVVEKLCSVLNKVCYKGENLYEMQRELQRLREESFKVEALLRKDDFQRYSNTTKLYIKERSKWKYRNVQDYAREIAKTLDFIASRIERTPFIDIVFGELESNIAKTNTFEDTLQKEAFGFLECIRLSLRWPSSRNRTLIVLVHFLMNLKKSFDYPDISVSYVSGFFSMNLELSSREVLKNYHGFGGEERLKEILLNTSSLEWYQLTPEDIIIREVKVFKNLDKPQIQLCGPSIVKKGECVQLRAMIVSCLSIAQIEWKMIGISGSKILDLSKQKYKGSVASQTSAMLHINDVNEDDESGYQVEISNTSGQSVKSNQVNFHVAKEVVSLEPGKRGNLRSEVKYQYLHEDKPNTEPANFKPCYEILERFKQKYGKLNIMRLYFGRYQNENKIVIAVVFDCDAHAIMNANVQSFENHDVVSKRLKEVVAETSKVEISEKAREWQFDHETAENIEKEISEKSRGLMETHSNLEIISGSCVKSQKSGTHLLHKPCVVLYCSIKGIIPLQENPFPTNIGDFPVDVREGFFFLSPNGNTLYQDSAVYDNLRMGCNIGTEGGMNTGTLGGFVELEEDIGFITCAHVLHEKLPIPEEKVNSSFRVVQPGYGKSIVNNICGEHVRSVCPFSKGPNAATVDAALIKVSPHRRPKNGLFAELTPEHVRKRGFDIDKPPTFHTGEIRDLRCPMQKEHRFQSCFKVGSQTGFTKGSLHLNCSTVRLVSATLKRQPVSCSVYKLFEIKPESDHFFATQGDSGALVFQAVTGTSPDRFVCIGMIIGIGDNNFCYVMPIKEVLKELHLPHMESLYPFNVPMEIDNAS